MWFRFVAALSVIAFLGMVWMLLSPSKGPQPDSAFRPAAMEPK